MAIQVWNVILNAENTINNWFLLGFLLLYLIRISDIYKMDIQVWNVILDAENTINNWFLLGFFASIFNQNFWHL